VTIHELKLHETLIEPNSNAEITRVDTGWIYYYPFRKDAIFIPDSAQNLGVSMAITALQTSISDVTMAIQGISTQLTYNSAC